MADEGQNLAGRVAQLESEVARLASLLEGQQATVQARPAAAPWPSPAAPRPRPAPAKAILPALNPVLLVAAAGAAIFLAGAVFFLRLAIQMGWVGHELRFLLGLLVGLALGGYGGRQFFRQAPGLGTCLLGAGLGTLLFTLYAGAFRYHFYGPALGFLGAGLITLVAGGLAAKARSGAALCVALVAGLAAPGLFSQGGHHELALALYLAMLLGAALAVPYGTGTGARWTTARWLALVGIWLWLGAAAEQLPRPDSAWFLALVLLHLALAGLWIWLPGQGEAKPSTPTLLWMGVTLATTGLLWRCWQNLGLMPEAFAAPVLAVAALNLALVLPLRARCGSRQADLGLLVLAGAHLALAVPVALDWAWVGPLWGLYAAGLAWAAGSARAQTRWEAGEVQALTLLATAMAALATLRWLVANFDGGPPLPFVNPAFAAGALTALAWALLARREGLLGRCAFVALEVVGNVVLARELGRVVRYAGGSGRAGNITHTLVLAASGALQWLYGLRPVPGARGLTLAGYGLLGVASLKLIVWDLDQSSTALRALVFLAVGAIFLGAAVLGQRLRPEQGGGR